MSNIVGILLFANRMIQFQSTNSLVLILDDSMHNFHSRISPEVSITTYDYCEVYHTEFSPITERVFLESLSVQA